MPSPISVGIILLLLLVNAVFVAAEFALLGVPKATVETKAREGDRVAIFIRRILGSVRNQDRYIATAQLGITLASLGLGGYGEHVISQAVERLLHAAGGGGWAAIHGISSVAAIVLLTYFHIVIGEMVPKSLALQHTWKTAAFISPLMRWATRLAYPAVALLNAMGNLILKVIGIHREDGASAHPGSEELEYIVQESRESGQLTSEAGQLLQEVFDFDALLAREVLVPRVKVAGIRLGATPDDLARLIRTSAHSRYPVYRDSLDNIIGIMHVRDVFNRIRSGKSVAEGDTRNVPFVPESASLNQVLSAMRGSGTQICVILDEFGGTEGIITLSDLFREVIGKVPEGELDVGEILEDGKGGALAAGTTRLEELGKKLKTALSHPEVDTVSGLVLDRLGRPPVPGDTVRHQGFEFRVTSIEGFGVRWAKVTQTEG